MESNVTRGKQKKNTGKLTIPNQPDGIGIRRRASCVPSFSHNLMNLANPFSPKTSEKKHSDVIKEELILEDNDFSMNIFTKSYEEYEEGHHSQKGFGTIKSFAYNSFRGLFKPGNEDKVAVVGQVKKPQGAAHKIWPKMSYFGIFDGHGGEGCSTFLRDNFLNILIENKNFPNDIKTSFIESFQKAEELFMKINEGKSEEDYDHSGSCALVILFVENKVWVANIGDSRAIMSINGGTKLKVLTTDHKPNNPEEYERAIKCGGKIYVDNGDDDDDDDNSPRDVEKLTFINDKSEFAKYNKEKDIVFREFPSDLAVMRTIGDFKAKKIPGSIISTPDIINFDFSPANDFIVMGCDGIYDDLSNECVINAVWFVIKNLGKQKKYDIHELTRDAVNMVIKAGLDRLTVDNLSCIIIGLEGLYKYINNKIIKEKNMAEINSKASKRHSSTKEVPKCP